MLDKIIPWILYAIYIYRIRVRKFSIEYYGIYLLNLY